MSAAPTLGASIAEIAEVETRTTKKMPREDREERSAYARALSTPLPANYYEREIQIAIMNLRRNGTSELSSSMTVIEARRRLATNGTKPEKPRITRLWRTREEAIEAGAIRPNGAER